MLRVVRRHQPRHRWTAQPRSTNPLRHPMGRTRHHRPRLYPSSSGAAGPFSSLSVSGRWLGSLWASSEPWSDVRLTDRPIEAHPIRLERPDLPRWAHPLMPRRVRYRPAVPGTGERSGPAATGRARWAGIGSRLVSESAAGAFDSCRDGGVAASRTSRRIALRRPSSPGESNCGLGWHPSPAALVFTQERGD